MASHHHCHHQQQTHHHHQSTCFSCCSSTCSPPHCSPPQLSPTDPLLQALASQILQQQTQQSQHHHHQQQHLFTQYLHKPNHQPQKHHQRQEQQQTQALLTSLVRRIKALETSLHNTSPSPTFTLRDHAARTIQIHFRAYLVRRSQTLRHLKHLANIKSSLKSLKSCVSGNPHFKSEALSQKAMDLLHKLDFIQGGDPMIRDGKRSISRELVQFLEFLDGVSLKRQQLHSKSMRRVRFTEENNETYEPYVCEDVEVLDDQGVSSDEQRELMESLCKKIENIEGLSRVYEDDDEEETLKAPRMNMKNKVNHGSDSNYQGHNGNSYFSAPLPVQMEKTVRDAR